MFAIADMSGAVCDWPRRPYDPRELPAEYHGEVLGYFRRHALRWLVRHARQPVGVSRATYVGGLRERAEEYASNAYVMWLEGRTTKIPAGAHRSAIAGVRRWMDRSGWQGRSERRRAANRELTAERLAAMARLRQRNLPDPATVAEWADTVQTARHRRKAGRIAGSIGTTLDRLATYAAGVEIMTTRARIVPDPMPAPIPCPTGAHCPWSPGGHHATTY